MSIESEEQTRLTNFLDQQRKETIVDENSVASFDHLNDVFVVHE